MEKIKKVIGLMKDISGGKIMKEFFGLRAKNYSYLKDNNHEDQKHKMHKKVYHKKNNLNFKIIKTVQKQLKQRET